MLTPSIQIPANLIPDAIAGAKEARKRLARITSSDECDPVTYAALIEARREVHAAGEALIIAESAILELRALLEQANRATTEALAAVNLF